MKTNKKKYLAAAGGTVLKSATAVLVQMMNQIKASMSILLQQLDRAPRHVKLRPARDAHYQLGRQHHPARRAAWAGGIGRWFEPFQQKLRANCAKRARRLRHHRQEG